MTVKSSEIYAELTRLTEAEAPCVLATVVRTRNATSAKPGSKAVVTQDGQITGWLGGSCVQRSLRQAAEKVLGSGKPALICIKPADDDADVGKESAGDEDAVALYRSSCPSGGFVEIFLEPVLPRAQLVVCGGSPITRAIAELGHWLGFCVVVAALAEDQANFDQADHRIEGFDLAGLPEASERYVVVATQGRHDKQALKAALSTTARYRAFVASREKGKALRAALLDEGIDGARLQALKNPAGLDIGGIGPEEVALSVLAEIVGLRRQAAGAKAEDGAATKPSETCDGEQSVA